ncbi:hypothetical protein PAXRUDRAFT_21935 [Paxillus rubicundulus Ve08.2h10]|uniref:Uncharacterized protein n=1 Tax=Paxillus rubicundulus Ve08.2h10 TaxID=930991 RepID=A0A0D0D6I8_9AGAM|nr:hypothetical protein PAXRUDRAFT_21935 [Paxillus rubicundulus Ve08.2h10]
MSSHPQSLDRRPARKLQTTPFLGSSTGHGKYFPSAEAAQDAAGVLETPAGHCRGPEIEATHGAKTAAARTNSRPRVRNVHPAAAQQETAVPASREGQRAKTPEAGSDGMPAATRAEPAARRHPYPGQQTRAYVASTLLRGRINDLTVDPDAAETLQD